MYLKEIKTTGFKSFADKVNITFENGITGIVGPNGSGKSNIVDAVRWVLGEQSVKSLRGDSSMMDVIFSGSKTRNPSSSASVTLVFDNSDKFFPVDYSEVSIKRAVYRTGENEYYLNNTKCRLKDITNLVIDTGVGRESFNIIAQDNIQEILSNKPEDRRVIFEEAAGVLKYKKRKEEALRKLDKTHENITRINDIINELEIQVEPLKEQSEKAKKYLDTKKELEQVEIALMVSDIEKINGDYHHTKDEVEVLNEEILTLSKDNTNVQADLEKEKLEFIKSNDELYKVQQELTNVSSEVEKLNGQKSLITERQKYQSEDIKLHDSIIGLKEQQLKVKNDIASIKRDIELKHQEYEEINNKVSDINDKIKHHKENIGLLNDKLNNNIRVQTELKHRINILEESIDNSNTLPHAVKVVLNNPKLKGIHDIIGNLIKMEDKYTTAIDVALGPGSQFIVVDNELAAKNAINYLKNNNAGRATFFPLNIIKARKIDLDTYDLIKNNESFIDIASNLVNYDDKYKDIILNQLGNVIVTSTIEGANEIGKIINYRYKVVTIDGELLHVGGSITGGNLKKTSTIISEKYELDSAKRNLINLTEEYSNINLKLNELETLLKEYELKNYNLRIEQASIMQIIDNKNDLEEEYTKNLEKIDNDIRGTNHIINKTLSDEENEIIKAYYEKTQERDLIAKKVEQISRRANEAKMIIEEMENNIKNSNSSYYKKQNTLKDLEIKLNRMDVKLDTLLNNLNEEYGMTFEKAKREYILVLEEKEARTKVNELKNIINDLGIVNIGSIEEYDRVSKRYEFLILQKNDLYKAENTLLEIIKEMDLIMKESFEETFKLIQIAFKDVFKELFGGGFAELKLTDPNNMLETGIEIIALPPGKKLQHISLLSGGEKALTAISLLFGILKVRPVPFSLLDEVEAALDEINVEGFSKFLTKLKNKTQFIIITHKKKTMEYVDSLYGITMQESGVSKLVSVKLEEVKN